MVSILYKWLLFFSVVSFSGTAASEKKTAATHPIFMSVTDIEHNAKDKTLEISCKIFTDDFEKTLRQTYKGTIDLINPKDKTVMNTVVNDYIQKHFFYNREWQKTGIAIYRIRTKRRRDYELFTG